VAPAVPSKWQAAAGRLGHQGRGGHRRMNRVSCVSPHRALRKWLMSGRD
jgi:hypothetical protein